MVISPSSVSSLEHLETLHLSRAEILWTGNVPSRMRRLRYLHLCQSMPRVILRYYEPKAQYWAFVGIEMVCHSTGFHQLRFLFLQDLHELEKWTVEEGAMGYLSSLEIHSCRRLQMIPDGSRSIKPLKELVIGGMPEEFQNRILIDKWPKGRGFRQNLPYSFSNN